MRRQSGADDPRQNHQGKIQFVDYSTRHIVVKVKGFGTIKRVNVQRGIQLGTTDRPVILRGDVATIFQKPSGRWVCSSITHKDHCATSPLPGEVIVDTSNEYISSNSIITQQLSALELPLLDLRFPPIEGLGQLTLSDFRFPDTHNFLCGLPPCTDCGTPEAGKVIVISSDVDHPFCYKYDFRLGACLATGTPLASGNTSYATSAYNLNKFEVKDGNYVYTLASKSSSGLGTADIQINVIDISDPITPIVVGTVTYNYVDFDPGFYINAIPSAMSKFGDYLYVPLVRNGNSLLWTQVFRVDVSDPTNPILEWDTNAFDHARYDGMELFYYAPDATLNAVVIMRDETNTTFSVAVLEITATEASLRSSVVAPSGGWRTAIQEWDVVSQYFYAQRAPGSDVIDIIDVTDPDNPVALSSFTTIYSTPGFALRVSANSQQLWVSRLDGLGTNDPYLEGWDISDKLSPVLLSTTHLGSAVGQRVLDMAFCATNRLFTVQGTPDIRAWDISDPTLPVETGTLAIASFSPLEILLSGAYVYVNGTLSSVPNLQVVAG